MARHNYAEEAYGIGDDSISLAPAPIIADRNPIVTDQAELGTPWINRITGSAYILTAVAGNATWTTYPLSASPIFTDVTISTGDLDITLGGINVESNILVNTGDLTLTAGDLHIAVGNAGVAGDVLIGGDLDVTTNTTLGGTLDVTGLTTVADFTSTGTFTISGDLDLTSAALIDMTSTLNASPCIYLHANGGAAESIDITSTQGTAADAIALTTTVGGMTFTTGLAADASFVVNSTGGIDADAAMQINITSSEATADCIRILGSNAASGADIDFGTGGIAVDTTGAFSIDGAAASNITLTGAFDMTLNSTAGSMIIDGGEAVADAIQLTASDVAGGITLTAGTGGITSVNTGALSLACTLASDITCTGADLTLESVGASVNIAADEAAVDAIDLNASAGGFSIDGVLASNITLTGAVDLTLNSTLGSVVIDGGEAVADAIQLTASDAAGGLTANVGTGGFNLVNTGSLVLAGTAASNITITGAFDLDISSTAGSVIVDGGEAAADAVQLTASDVAGGVTLTAGTGGITSVNTGALSLACTLASDITCTGADLTLESVGASVNVTADEAANDAIALDATAGGFSIDGILQSNVTVTGAGEDLNLMSVGGSVYIDGSEAVTNAVRIISTGVGGGIDIDADTGGLFMDSGGTFSVDGVTASNVTVTGAGEDLTLSSVGGSVLVQSTEASATAIRLYASDAAGGLSFEGDGLTEMESANATIASPVVIATVDANVIDILATGFTTAAGATEVFTITCNQVSTTSPILHGCCNEGANDAQMTITRVNRAAGSFVVTVTNNGAAALNGNLHMTFWVTA